MQTGRVRENTKPWRPCGQPSSASVPASRGCSHCVLYARKVTFSAVLRENSQLSSLFFRLKLRSTNNTQRHETSVTAYVQGSGAQRELLSQTHHQGNPATMTEFDVPQERTAAAHVQPAGSLHTWPVSRHRLAVMPPPHATAAHTSRMSTPPPAHCLHLDQYSQHQRPAAPITVTSVRHQLPSTAPTR